MQVMSKVYSVVKVSSNQTTAPLWSCILQKYCFCSLGNLITILDAKD